MRVLAIILFCTSTLVIAATMDDIPVVYGYEVAEKEKEILEAINNYGAVIIKEAIDSKILQSYSKIIQQQFVTLDAKLQADKSGLTERQKNHLQNYNQQGGMSFSYELDPLLDNPIGVRDYIFLVRKTGLLPIMHKYLGHRPTIQIDGSSVRRQSVVHQDSKFRKGLKYHQDGNDANNSGVVFWVPLVDIDNDTPTLKVIIKKFDKYFSFHADEVGFAIIDEQEKLEKNYEESIVTLNNMRLGDILLFDFTTVHSTYVNENMNKTRFSIDVRLQGVKNNVHVGDVEFLT